MIFNLLETTLTMAMDRESPMLDISLRQIAQLLGSNTVSGMAKAVGLKWPPPPPISVRDMVRHMYNFRLDSFHIDNTRARHTDTDVVAFFLKVGDKSYGTQTKHMGDLNNGDYSVGLEFNSIPIPDPTTPVSFNYQIVNAGNFNGDIDARLSITADVIAGALAGTLNPWAIIAAGGI